MKKVFLIGDSTVCKFNDMLYYYPRFGYGTQLDNYFDNLEFINIAMSGRSSKSFIKEDNYKVFLDNISSGDYLVLGFGHNDEKFDDPMRFSSCLGSINDEGSFKYNLYNYYIKVALENNATPILCTPICRCDSDNCYDGVSAHITSKGDYNKCIIDLANELGITCIDLTKKTKELYLSLGFNEAIKMHAWTTSNPLSCDTTHVNYFGAKMIAYLFAEEVRKSNSSLKDYLKNEYNKPTIACLDVNPLYVERIYEAFDSNKYKPSLEFNCKSNEWFGTAFGDVGCNPSNPLEGGFTAKKIADNKYLVGQHLESMMNKGKVASTEGGAYIFRQVSVDDNFTCSCKVKVVNSSNTMQQGFGLVIRDDIYVNQILSDASLNSNYVSAGMYSTISSTNICYKKENTKLEYKYNIPSLYQVNDEAILYVERLGQVASVKVIYKGVEYTNTYTDFDFVAIDNKYMYVALFATRGTVIEVTDLKFEITGKAIKA